MSQYSFLSAIASGKIEALTEAAAPKQVFAVLPKGKFNASKAVVTYKSKKNAVHTLEGYGGDTDQLVVLDASGAGQILDINKQRKKFTDLLVASGLAHAEDIEDGEYPEVPDEKATGSGQGFVDDWMGNVIFNAKFVKVLKAAGFGGIRSSEASENFEKIIYAFVPGTLKVVDTGAKPAKKTVTEAFDTGFKTSAEAVAYVADLQKLLRDARLKKFADPATLKAAQSAVSSLQANAKKNK